MLSIVVPLYNEAENVSRLLASIAKFKDNNEIEVEVILVDDASTDDTLSLLNDAVTQGVKVITYNKNMGKGYALRTGIGETSGDYVFFTDADLAYGLDIINRAMEIFQKDGPDAVVGSRLIDRDGYSLYPFSRKVMSRVFIAISRMALGMRLSDMQCGIKGFSGKVARDAFKRCKTNRFGIDFEVMYLLYVEGRKIKEMPARVIYHGKSSVHPIRDSIKTLQELFNVKKRVKRG